MIARTSGSPVRIVQDTSIGQRYGTESTPLAHMSGSKRSSNNSPLRSVPIVAPASYHTFSLCLPGYQCTVYFP